MWPRTSTSLGCSRLPTCALIAAQPTALFATSPPTTTGVVQRHERRRSRPLPVRPLAAVRRGI